MDELEKKITPAVADYPRDLQEMYYRGYYNQYLIFLESNDERKLYLCREHLRELQEYCHFTQGEIAILEMGVTQWRAIQAEPFYSVLDQFRRPPPLQ
jgi:hypothetical protein